MYAETDFILALIKEDDWLSKPAEKIYQEHRNDIWTSPYTLLEIMLVSYREDWNVLRMVSYTKNLFDFKEDPTDIMKAPSYVTKEGFTPFDALHLVTADGDTIISSDSDYDGYNPRLKLEDQEKK